MTFIHSWRAYKCVFPAYLIPFPVFRALFPYPKAIGAKNNAHHGKCYQIVIRDSPKIPQRLIAQGLPGFPASFPLAPGKAILSVFVRLI